MTLDQALAEIEALKGTIETKDTKISELSTNLTNQRKTLEGERDAAFAERDAAQNTIKEAADKSQKELSDYTEKRITAMSKGDTAIADKIRAEYATINITEDSRENIDARALKAFQLATATSVDPLAQRTDNLEVETSTDSTEKLSPAAADTYQRMFPDSKVVGGEAAA